jgi:methyl-accepting chemotaxis protein
VPLGAREGFLLPKFPSLALFFSKEKQMHFGVRAKLISAFLVIVSLTLISSGVSFYSIRAFKSALDEVVIERVPLMSEAISLKTAVDGALSALSQITQNKDQNLEEEWGRVASNLTLAQRALTGLKTKNVNAKTIENLQTQLTDLTSQIEEIKSLILDYGTLHKDTLNLLQKAATQLDQVRSDVGTDIDVERQFADQVVEDVTDEDEIESAKLSELVNNSAKLFALSALRSSSEASYSAMESLIVLNDETQIKSKAFEATSAIEKSIEGLSVFPDGVASYYKKQLLFFSDFFESEKGLINLRLTALKNEQNIDQLTIQNHTLSEQLSKIVSDLTVSSRQEVAKSADQATQIGAAMIKVTWVVIIASIAISLALIFFFVIRHLNRRLRILSQGMDSLSKGNLEIEIHDNSMDAIGRMARSLEIFRQNALQVETLKKEKEENDRRAEEEKKVSLIKMSNDFEEQVLHILDDVIRASEDVSSEASSLIELSEMAKTQANNVASASEQAKTDVHTVASASEELSASIRSIEENMNLSYATFENAVKASEESTTRINSLEEVGSQVSSVIGLISDIAEQTNLLALNATIEAQRAGVHGKGFAVVAMEVKKLAEQTSEATDKISLQITQMRDATYQAVKAIEESTRLITEINEINENTVYAVREQSSATDEIASSVMSASEGTRQVNEHIGDVLTAANDTDQSAVRVGETSRNVVQQSHELRNAVSGFLANIRG